jgi:hypothetical protein
LAATITGHRTAGEPHPPSGNNGRRHVSSYDVTSVPYQPPEPSRISSALNLLAPASRARDATDPELANLPRSTDRGRLLTLLVLVFGVVAALGMVVALASDASYAFSGAAACALGDLSTVSPAALGAQENRTVTGVGLLGVAGALRYERPLREDTFRALPVLGRSDLWVEVRVPVGKEGGRWEPPRSFNGRLEKLDAGGPSHRGLRDAIEQAGHTRLPRDVWLIVDGDHPAQARWSLVLMIAFLSCAAWNAVAIARIVRKVSS